MLTSLRRKRQAGVSIVELLVGVTVGLFLTGGAITMFVVNLKTSRQLLLEARVNQDLRAAADLVARELRRAGYWENAIAGTRADATGAGATGNVYSEIVLSGTNTVEYSQARDVATSATRAANLSALNSRNSSDEILGFSTSGGVLQMKFGRAWQPLTDPNIVTINDFEIVEDKKTLDIRTVCTKTCTSGCPEVHLRSYQIHIKGTATHDSNVVRVLRENVRVRTEALTGSCPA